VKKDDLIALARLIESGEVKPVIAKTYSLAETAAAMEAVGAAHVPGKVVIAV
jgi:NADPH:quinone reductase-like Zn-dependent oxidoreductase